MNCKTLIELSASIFSILKIKSNKICCLGGLIILLILSWRILRYHFIQNAIQLNLFSLDTNRKEHLISNIISHISKLPTLIELLDCNIESLGILSGMPSPPKFNDTNNMEINSVEEVINPVNVEYKPIKKNYYDYLTEWDPKNDTLKTPTVHPLILKKVLNNWRLETNTKSEQLNKLKEAYSKL